MTRDDGPDPQLDAPRFSVVIPALDEEGLIGACLMALQEQTFVGRWDVVVVDNGSTDDTVVVAARHGARVLHEPRRGVCFARQRGLEEARGTIIVSLDADTVVPPHWLQHIDDVFRSQEGVVAVAGPCAYADGPWWSRTWTTLLFGTVTGVARVTGRVVYVTATNLAFERQALSAYDTSLTQGGDELDVLRRLRREGLVVFSRDHGVRTSARRLERGLLYSAVVALGFQYGLGYTVNRLTGRTIIGAAPCFRTAATGSVRADQPPVRRSSPSASTGAPTGR